MKTILLLVGASGSGKTTVANELCRKYGLKQINSYTTRPPRYHGEAGHIFVSDEEFDLLHDFVGFTNYNNYRYGATAEQVEACDIYVIDPAGVDFFRKEYHGGKQVVVAELIVDEHTREARMKKRGDSANAIRERLAFDALVYPTMDADCYFTNVDASRTADVIYHFLTEQE